MKILMTNAFRKFISKKGNYISLIILAFVVTQIANLMRINKDILNGVVSLLTRDNAVGFFSVCLGINSMLYYTIDTRSISNKYQNYLCNVKLFTIPIFFLSLTILVNALIFAFQLYYVFSSSSLITSLEVILALTISNIICFAMNRNILGNIIAPLIIIFAFFYYKYSVGLFVVSFLSCILLFVCIYFEEKIENVISLNIDYKKFTKTKFNESFIVLIREQKSAFVMFVTFVYIIACLIPFKYNFKVEGFIINNENVLTQMSSYALLFLLSGLIVFTRKNEMYSTMYNKLHYMNCIMWGLVLGILLITINEVGSIINHLNNIVVLCQNFVMLSVTLFVPVLLRNNTTIPAIFTLVIAKSVVQVNFAQKFITSPLILLVCMGLIAFTIYYEYLACQKNAFDINVYDNKK